MKTNIEQSTPLVTVAVIAYNSADYIIETLESVKKQTYPNIELIVSDDGSVDDTVPICRDWIKDNAKSFVHTQLITVEKNTGVTGNCNRALFAAKGEWMKDHAADDILLPKAIENFVAFINQNPNAKAVFGRIKTFTGDYNSGKEIKDYHIALSNLCFGKMATSHLQYRVLSRHYIGCAPAFFVNTHVAKSLGGYDERFPMIEDSPMYLRLTKNGHKLYLMPNVVVHQRVRADSIFNTRQDSSLITNAEIRNAIDYHNRYRYENSTCFWKIMSKYSCWITSKIVKYGNSKQSTQARFWYFIRKWINPYKYDLILLTIVDKFFLSFPRTKADFNNKD